MKTPQRYFYTIACYLSGVFVFAMIVGNAGSIILDRNASRMEFEKQRDNAKNYMKIHNVPGDLQRRVVKWYDYSWSRGRMNGGGGDLNSLHLLPDKMKTEVALHVHLETLRKVTFLQNCEPEFLHELLLKMRLHIFTPGDLIIRHGEIAREMYLIAHGRIEVISETGKMLKELGSGDFFGEIGILSLSEGQNRRTADVRSIGYTECFVLSKDDVLGEIHQFPQAQKILAEYGRKRLQNTSDDPRLVKLDGQNSPLAKNRWQITKSHVVNMLNENQNNLNSEKQSPNRQSPSSKSSRPLAGLFKSVVLPSLNSPENIITDDSPVSDVSCSREPMSKSRDNCHLGESRDGPKGARDELKSSRDKNVSCGKNFNDQYNADERAQHVARTENNCHTRGSTGASRESVTRTSRDIGSCLNTLDYLKAVMQSTMHESERQNELLKQTEREMAKEKERVQEAEQKIKDQEEEIQRLLENNRILKEQIKQSNSKICNVEDAFQLTSDSSDDERKGRGLESLKDGQSVENILTRDTILDISDTQC